MNVIEEQMALLKRIAQLRFVGVDLNLYLDTHPTDRNALDAYNYFSKELNECLSEYEMKFGPLINFGQQQSGYPWQWNMMPWPWCRVLGVQEGGKK